MTRIPPIQRIPPEVLSTIFLYCIPTASKNYAPTPNPKLAPMLLCTVCAVWRNTALLTPQLWTSFSLRVYDDSPTNPSRLISAPRLPLLRLYLRRSGAIPLSFCACLQAPLDDIPSDTAAEFLSVIKSIFLRCQFLHFDAPPSLFSSLLCDPNISFPLLESLVIECGSHLPRGLPSQRLAVAPSAHRLHSLTLWAVGIPEFKFIRLPTSLTRIEIFSPADSCLDILYQCHHLRTVYIALSHLPNRPRGLIVLPDLQFLCVDRFFLAGPIRLFDTLILPALRILVLKCYRPNVDYPKFTLLSLLSRSGCPLEELHILGWGAEPEQDYSEFHQHIPSLRLLSTVATTSLLSESSLFK